jgi:hypothetical protein
VAVRLTGPVKAREMRAGDTFGFDLAAPVIVDGEVLLPAGAAGRGRVVQSSPPGPGGKGAKLVLAADYLVVGDRTVPLEGFTLAGAGKSRSLAASVVGFVGGAIFMPLGLAGLALPGGDVEIPAGTTAVAKIGAPVALPALAAATPRDYQVAHALFADEPTTSGRFDVPPPPPGMGQVVFFREPSVLGFGQWFKVREHGRELGKLTNGAWFVAPMTPGLHRYTATSEPEFKDSLTERIDPGETYYVEGIMTKGLLIGVADLTPSDKARFDTVSNKLKGGPISSNAYAAAAPPELDPPRP